MLSYIEILQRFEEQLSSYSYGNQPQRLYEPIKYIMSLGGKRLRPVLLLTANQMCQGNIEKAMPAAMAIESFHNFTLLHDDIMDKSEMRRGKPTVNTKWNDNIAILSGDTLFAKAYEMINLLPAEQLKESLQLFTQTAIEVCEGQQYDMDFETATEVSIEEYCTMIRLKTAVLIAASLKMGALLAGAVKEEQVKFYKLGEEIGMAFQIKDDSLDVFGQQQAFGKETGLDIYTNKKTFVFLKAFEMADLSTKTELKKAFSIQDKTRKIEKVTALYYKIGVKEEAEKRILFHHNAASQILNSLNCTSTSKETLEKLIHQLIDREV
jgi:geranylgeranyl diphosphate synthase type II